MIRNWPLATALRKTLLCGWICLLSMVTACVENRSDSTRYAGGHRDSSWNIPLAQFLAQAPQGLYLLSDSRNKKPLLYVKFSLDSSKVLSAHVAGFPQGSPYNSSSLCTFCPSDHRGYGKALQGLRLMEELRPGRRGWIGGQFLDPTLGYTYLADLEQAHDGNLSLVLRIGSQRRVIVLRPTQGS